MHLIDSNHLLSSEQVLILDTVHDGGRNLSCFLIYNHDAHSYDEFSIFSLFPQLAHYF